MKLHYILLLIFGLVLCGVKGLGQCPNGNLFFATQEQVDDFLVDYPDCTELQESVTIGFLNFPTNDITNLNGLENLTSIEGDFEILYHDSLTNLNGLENLTSIGGDFNIRGNGGLVSLNGLNNLSSINGRFSISLNDALMNLDALGNLSLLGDDFSIFYNIALTNLSGLDNITSLSGDFWITSNSNLPSLSGLENLTSVDGTVKINNNGDLLSLSGLENLVSVGGNIDISNSDGLTNLSGLGNLTSIGGNFWISMNPNLINLNGLDNITSIGSDIFISSNPVLVSLEGLDNLSSVEGNITIQWNTELSFCSTPPICTALVNGNTFSLNNNAIGCNTVSEIQNFCIDQGTISIKSYYDQNQNGTYDIGETNLPGIGVNIDPGGYTAYGTPSQSILKYLFFGDYSFSLNESNLSNWGLTSTPDIYNITLDNTNDNDTLYFGLYPSNFTSDLSASFVNGLPRCNEYVLFEPMAINKGTTITNGTMWFQIDENVLDITLIDQPDTLDGPNRFGWHFSNLYPHQVLKKQISVQLPGPPAFPIGDNLTFETEVFFSDQININVYDNYEHSLELLCSYDPNDKLVQPVYPENYALIEDDLIYTIRFQNTGNAEAYDVVITDELSLDLDLSTFKVITSSHEEVLSTFLEDNIATFEFRNIFLPDSTTNFEESQGYVIYRIRPFDNISENTIITNSASIYFDLNPAIVTNTTENLLVSTFDADEDEFLLWEDCDDTDPAINPSATEIPNNGVDEDCDGADLVVSNNSITSQDIHIFPSPTSGIINIHVPSSLTTANLEVRDASGRHVLNIELEQSGTLDLSTYANGVYTLFIQSSEMVRMERVVKF